MFRNQVDKPKERGRIRKFVGKEYFIFKRKLKWIFSSQKYAAKIKEVHRYEHSVVQHKSFLLRPLKDVDMYLQHNKVTNLRLAIKPLDNLVIQPGEVFSLWKLVGRPTKYKGYLEGMVLHNGQVLKGRGGGLCQLGNLLYWMFLHSPLSIVERWRHSYDVFPDINRKIPFACGATLSYNYIDLQAVNNTEKSFSIHLWLDAEYLHGEIKSDKELHCTYQVYETDHQIKQQFWGAYTRHNKIWRKIYNKRDQVEHIELLAENHAIMMYNPLLDNK